MYLPLMHSPHNTPDFSPEAFFEPPPETGLVSGFAREINRRAFLGGCLRLGATVGATALAMEGARRQWYELILRNPGVQTIYNVNAELLPNRHLVHLDGTATTHTWSSHALIPSAGQYAQIHAIKHGSEGISHKDLAELVHTRMHDGDYPEHATGLYAEPFQEVVLVGTSEGANMMVAIAVELKTNPLYRNTHIAALVLRDLPFGEESILGIQQSAAKGMNAGRSLVTQVGPAEYFLGALAHVAFDSLPWWQKPIEAWNRTMNPIGPKTLADQLKSITDFPADWPEYARTLSGVPIHLLLSGSDELIRSAYSSEQLRRKRPDIVVHDLPGAPHATYYFDDATDQRAQYFNQSSVIQQILLSVGWRPQWDVAAGKPYPEYLDRFRNRNAKETILS